MHAASFQQRGAMGIDGRMLVLVRLEAGSMELMCQVLGLGERVGAHACKQAVRKNLTGSAGTGNRQHSDVTDGSTRNMAILDP